MYFDTGTPEHTIARIILTSFTLFVSSSSVQPQSKEEQRQAHFRNSPQSNPTSVTAQPQTGLGILMNRSASAATAPSRTKPYATHLTPEQQVRIQVDLADREKQASSLAAAGLVADSVDYTARPAGPSHGQVLRAPPALFGMSVPTAGPSAAVPISSLAAEASTNSASAPPPAGSNNNNEGNGGVPQVESINWNLDVDSAGPMLGAGLDDIDMDFATLFDSEEQLLPSEGAVAGAQR